MQFFTDFRQKWRFFKSKCDREMDFYWSDFDELEAAEKLWIPAPQRRQFYQKRSNVDPFGGHMVIFG